MGDASRPFPAEVVDPADGTRKTILVTKHYSEARGEWLTDPAGNQYLRRIGAGSGIEKIAPTEDIPATAETR